MSARVGQTYRRIEPDGSGYDFLRVVGHHGDELALTADGVEIIGADVRELLRLYVLDEDSEPELRRRLVTHGGDDLAAWS